MKIKIKISTNQLIKIAEKLLYIFMAWSLVIVFTTSFENLTFMEMYSVFSWPINCCLAPIFILLAIIIYLYKMADEQGTNNLNE